MPKVKGKGSDKDGERELLEHVYEYLAHSHYPEGCDKNHKRNTLVVLVAALHRN